MSSYNPFYNQREETKKSFSLIQKNGPMVKADLVKLSGLTLSTLNRVLAPVEDAKLIVDSGEAISTGGRKPHFYDVNRESPIIVGIEISRLFVRVALVNLKIEVVSSEVLSMTNEIIPSKMVDQSKKSIENQLKELGLEIKDIAAIGVGTSGKIDRENGVLIYSQGFPEGWENAPIVSLFEKHFKCPITLDSGANAAVVAEYLFGSGRDSDHVAYFHVGMGIRTGVINSGKLIRAINDKEDALGHMIVDIDGLECTCGNFGCVEAASSITAILRRFKDEISKGKVTSIEKKVDNVTIEDICEAAEHGDELSKAIITDAGMYFGTGLANYISLMNPHTVILSGPLVSHSPLFFRICTGVAIKKCLIGEENALVFRRGCRYKEDVIVAGMASIIIEDWLESGLV